MKILLTGGTGFVGRSVLIRLINMGHHVACILRRHEKEKYWFDDKVVEKVYVDSLDSNADLGLCLKGVDLVIHLAAHVHRYTKSPFDQLNAFIEINCKGTLNLVRQAFDSGVKRFVFLSTIGVNGNKTDSGQNRTGNCNSKGTSCLRTRCQG